MQTFTLSIIFEKKNWQGKIQLANVSRLYRQANEIVNQNQTQQRKLGQYMSGCTA